MSSVNLRSIVLAILIVASLSLTGQDFNFDILNTSLHDYIKLEEGLGGVRIQNKENYISFSGEAQPIKFQRKEKVIPDLISHYFFKKADSAMTYVLYEWDLKNFNTESNNPQNLKVQEALINKFNELEKKITSQYGLPESTGSLDDIELVNSKGGLRKNCIWKPTNDIEIEMYTTISNYYETNGASSIPTVHRLRLYIRNNRDERKPEILELTTEKIESLDRTARNFLRHLSSRNFNKTRTVLSELIRNQVTDQQLEILSENIVYEKEIQIFSSGTQLGLNGQLFVQIQYNYSDDTSSPPKNLIRFIFDSNDLIAGVQPIRF